MDNSDNFKGRKSVISDSSGAVGGRDLRGITAKLYARDLVKFVLRHHGISYQSALPVKFYESQGGMFDEDVGKIVVAYARSSEKDALKCTAYDMRLILTLHEFSAYCLRFHNWYFSMFGCSPESAFKYFAYVIEKSVLLYIKGLHDAPLIAEEMITAFLLDDEHSQFMIDGGLGVLNKTARSIVASDPSIRDAYESGTFPW